MKEMRLAVGRHRVQALKEGKVLREELVTISRGGRTVLTVHREPEEMPPPRRDRMVLQPSVSVGMDSSPAVQRLARTLHSLPPLAEPRDIYQMDIYLRDLASGEARKIADKTLTSLPAQQDPDWSHDGRRIVFDAGRYRSSSDTRILVMEVQDGRAIVRNLGAGCCPRFSSGDHLIAFALFENQGAGEAPGVYLMNADGTNRRKVSDMLMAPFWVADGTRLLLNSFMEPNEPFILNLADWNLKPVPDAGKPFYSWLRPTPQGGLLACVGQGNAAAIVPLSGGGILAREKELAPIWERRLGPDVFPRWPVMASLNDLYFIGDQGSKRTLYHLRHRGQHIPDTVTPLETGGPRLSGLSLSPDGRYLLFAADRLDSKSPPPTPVSTGNTVTQTVDRLAAVLKRNQPRHGSKTGVRMQLYMRDLVEGRTTLVADEPIPGLSWTGAPDWSHDGKQIAFDTSPGTDWVQSRIMILEGHAGRPTFRELGPGNCPKFSPDDRHIAFLLNPGAVAGQQAGVWVMRSDGSDRRHVGGVGAPFWSADGQQLLINGFGDPTDCALYDLKTRRMTQLMVPGQKIFSWPRWAGPGTLVACIGTGQQPDSIALLDLTPPNEVEIVETLWNRRPQLDVYARWPLFSPSTGLCYFVGVDGNTRTLYSVKRGEGGQATALEGEGHEDELGGLGFSPDGRYLLFGANRPDRR